MAVLDIQIHGRSYQIACDDGQETHVRGLANHLHERVSELAGRMGGSVPEGTLLAITALMLADELNEQAKAAQTLRTEIGDSSQSFEVAKMHELEMAMADTINAIADDLELFAQSVESR